MNEIDARPLPTAVPQELVLVVASPYRLCVWGPSGQMRRLPARIADQDAGDSSIAYLERWSPGAPAAAIDVLVGGPTAFVDLEDSVSSVGPSAFRLALQSAFADCDHSLPLTHYVDPWQSLTAAGKCAVQRMPSTPAHKLSMLAKQVLSASDRGDVTAAAQHWREVEQALSDLRGGDLISGGASSDDPDDPWPDRAGTGDPNVDNVLNLVPLDTLHRLSLAGQAATGTTRSLVLSGLGQGSRHLLADMGVITDIATPTPELTEFGERVLAGAILVTSMSTETRMATAAAIDYLADLDERLGVTRE